MLNNETLDGLRAGVFAAVHKLHTHGDAGDREVWIEWINDPDSASTTSLLEYVRDSRFEPDILRALAAIGAAVADDLLLRLPIPISMISDVEWQRKRELAIAVEQLSGRDLQRLIWQAEAMQDAAKGIVRYEPQREPGESDADFNRRRRLFSDGRISISVDELSAEEIEMIADSEIPAHLRWTLDDLDRRMAVLRLIVFALEAGGITGHEQADFATELGLPETWFVDAAESGCRDIPLDQLAQLYDAAAARVGWLSFREVVAHYVDEARGRS